jgi:tetratricopeptide (TPR) repeat protein
MHQEAIEHYRQATKIAPAFDDAYLNLAAVYYNLGLRQEAREALRQVDTNCPNPKYKTFRERINGQENIEPAPPRRE